MDRADTEDRILLVHVGKLIDSTQSTELNFHILKYKTIKLWDERIKYQGLRNSKFLSMQKHDQRN